MPKSWFLRLLFGAIILVAGMLVWRVWFLGSAYRVIGDVPPGMIAGPANGDLTVTMLFDYNCPYCHKSYPVLLDAARRDGRVRIALRPIAVQPTDVAPFLAVAANAQGKFLEFHDGLMQVDPPINEESCHKVSDSLGLDWARLKKDSNAPETLGFLDAGLQKALALDIRSTPTFILNQIVYTPQTAMPTATDFLRLFDEARKDREKSSRPHSSSQPQRSEGNETP